MIQIIPPRSEWRGEFQELGARVRRYLNELALRIDHIGSTSVADLPAKDVIDMQVTVEQLEPAVEAALMEAGFYRLTHIHCDHVPPGASSDPAQWTKWIFNENPGGRRVNLHVRIAGRANQRYAILFRDYLRAHPAAAQAYAQVKNALARYHPDNAQAYYDVKDPVCDIVMVAAEEWANSIGWNPGPSDA
ncbi:MAG TPA: GrpB family protein [Tepidisphaeraceae bacterium]|jgi:GrpB-like predicted nucleotidyltransferase (UPF0157 family)